MFEEEEVRRTPHAARRAPRAARRAPRRRRGLRRRGCRPWPSARPWPRWQCTLLEADEAGLPGVILRVAAPNKKGVEQSVVMRALMPPEYPSHLPPTVEIMEGVEGKAECSLVQDSLTLLFFDEYVGTCVMPMWAEWLRDEWIAKQTTVAEAVNEARSSTEPPSADSLLKFGKQ